MKFEHFAHKPNFFPYFPVWQGKMPSAWAARSGATAGSARRLDYTLFRGDDEGIGNHTFEEDSMETVGLGFCFEDLPVGRRFKTIGRTVTEADITNFVNCTGMVEVLFTNLGIPRA